MQDSRKIEDLEQPFRTQYIEIVSEFEAKATIEFGQPVKWLTTSTYRSPETQARLYRQSRTTHEIKQKMQSLERRGFPELAAIIRAVGPQSGRIGAHVTWVGPGQSWHQYGLAADGVPQYDVDHDGDLDLQWDADHRIWRFYGDIVEGKGLVWGGSWRNPDKPHILLYGSGDPLNLLPREEILERLDLA